LRRAFARAPFDGEGAYLYGGRWSSPGTRIAYSSEHQSLAMLEYFVHLDSDHAPDDLVLVAAQLPDNIPRLQLKPDQLPALWRRSPAPPQLAQIGDEFARKAERCCLIVPSALSPNENNCLFNPLHPEFRHLIVSAPKALNYDPRMFDPPRRARRK
jgi:RES domain-containing protein